MGAVYKFDDSNFQKLYEEMDTKRRMQALKGGFRREANNVRKAAVNNLRSSGVRSNRALEKGIWSKVYKIAGFTVRVTFDKARNKGFYKAKQRDLPVLLFMEGGTKERKTKSQTRYFVRTRAGHPTGKLKRYAFMEKTRREVAGSVAGNLHNEILNNVERIAKKYGCK